MDIVFIVENIVFWFFVYIIVFLGCETPQIVFGGFGFFLIYWLFRSVLKQKGFDKAIYLYVVNMVLTVLLLFYFMTGATIQKSMRNALNSAARKYPSLDPYVKSC